METTITGIDDINRLLGTVAPRVGLNIMRSTIHSVAGSIRDGAKDYMAEDTGTMKKATKAKRERIVNGQVSSTVRVGPEAFYWRFEEYGDGPDGLAKDMFLKSVADFRSEMDAVMVREFGKKFEAAMARARKAAS